MKEPMFFILTTDVVSCLMRHPGKRFSCWDNGEGSNTLQLLYFESLPVGGNSSNSSIVGTSLALRIWRRNCRAMTGAKSNPFSPEIVVPLITGLHASPSLYSTTNS